jgi:hypothetical protein
MDHDLIQNGLNAIGEGENIMQENGINWTRNTYATDVSNLDDR